MLSLENLPEALKTKEGSLNYYNKKHVVKRKKKGFKKKKEHKQTKVNVGPPTVLYLWPALLMPLGNN